MPGIRKHIETRIQNVYQDMDVTMETYPQDHTVDSKAYLKALDCFQRGDAVTIFTPVRDYIHVY